MRSSRISRISRVSGSAGGKRISVIEPKVPTKQIGVRSPRCLGPSSPFAYLKEPDAMNILPLDKKSEKFCMVGVQNSTYNKKRRALDATLEAISRDLEHVTWLFQEITPEAPVKVDKAVKDIPKESGLQVLEAVLQWLKAANFDLVWAKSAIDDKDLDDCNEKVQSELDDSIRSIDRLRAIHNQLMVKFNEYFSDQNTDSSEMPSDAFHNFSSAISHAVDLLAAESSVSAKVESLPVSKTDSGSKYSAMSADVMDLLQQERVKTAEKYEAKLHTMKTALSSQATLIKQLTDNLKGKSTYDAPRSRERYSSDEADVDALMSKKAKMKKKQPGAPDDEDGGESSATHGSRATSDDSGKDSKNKEMLSLQKTLRTCQVDSSRLLQQNRVLLETKKELTTSNAHKDKIIGELKARLLTSDFADKPKIDRLVVAAPKSPRDVQPQGKPERPVSPRSRFIYMDSPEGGGQTPSAGHTTPEPPARPMAELLAQKKGALRLHADDDDDDDEDDAVEAGGAGRASAKGKSSGDVRDSEMLEKDKKVKKNISSDLEKVRSDDIGEVGAEKTHGRQTGVRDGEKVSGDRSVVAGAGGKAVSDLDVHGAVEGKGRDARGKDGRVSESASAGGVSAGAARERVGVQGSGHERELRRSEDRAVGKARDGSRSRGSSASGQEVHEGADSAMGQKRSKGLLSSSSSTGRKSSGDQLQTAGQLYDQSGDATTRLDRDAKRSDRVGGKISLTDTSAQGRLPPGMDQADQMSGGLRGRPMSSAEKEAERQRMGSALSMGPGGSVGSLASGRNGTEKGDSSYLASGVSKYSHDRSQSRDGDQRSHVRYGTPDEDYISGMDGRSPVSGAVGLKGMPQGQGPAFGAIGGKGMPEGQGPAFGGVGWKGMPQGQGPAFGAIGGKGMPEGQGPAFGGVGWKGMPQGQGQAFGAIGGKGMPEGQGPAFGGVGWKGMPQGQGQAFGAVGWKGMSEGQGPAFGGVGWKGMHEGQGPAFGGVGWKGMHEGQGPAFGAVGWEGMPDMGGNFGCPLIGRLGSADTTGFKYNVGAFTPQQMGQRLAWTSSEKEGVVPFGEELSRGLRVIGETAVHSDKLGTGKGLTDAFPLIHPLTDSIGMARVLRSYAVNLNDPNTFEQQLEFIKHSGTMDGLREAMRLVAPHLKLLGDNEQQGDSVLMDVMRSLQKRHIEMITEEFQPAIGKDAAEAKQRKLLTFVTDRKQDICSARARLRSQLTQGQARGLVHLRPLLGYEANALSPCPPYLPSGYMDALPQKLMRNTFPSQKAQRLQQVPCPRRTKLRSGDQYLMVDNLLQTIDRWTKCGQAASG